MHAARTRREQELCQLVLNGVPLRTRGKSGHWTIGPLHIYTASGRWFNEKTGGRGRLHGQSMRRLIEGEYRDLPLSDDQLMSPGDSLQSILRRGQQLCPEVAQETKRLAILYQQYDTFMARAAKHTAKYERFMRDTRSAQRKQEGSGTGTNSASS